MFVSTICEDITLGMQQQTFKMLPNKAIYTSLVQERKVTWFFLAKHICGEQRKAIPGNVMMFFL